MSGNLSSLAIGGGAIKSIQRGSGAAGAVTVTAVNTSKSLLSNLGSSSGNSSAVLTNSTTVTLAASAGNVSWELVEYY